MPAELLGAEAHKATCKLALVPLCRDNIRRVPVMTENQVGSCMLELDCC